MEMKVHSERTKFCHYFNNDATCPYEDIGCIFLHKASGKCQNISCQIKFCPFKHNEAQEIIEDVSSDTSEDEFEETEVGCKLCGCTFLDHIVYH